MQLEYFILHRVLGIAQPLIPHLLITSFPPNHVTESFKSCFVMICEFRENTFITKSFVCMRCHRFCQRTCRRRLPSPPAVAARHRRRPSSPTIAAWRRRPSSPWPSAGARPRPPASPREVILQAVLLIVN